MDKTGLLQTVVANIHVEPLPADGQITEARLNESPFVRARLGPQGYIGILKKGGSALSDLTDLFFHTNPNYVRGTTFEEIAAALFEVVLAKFLQRTSDSITAADVAVVERALADWFTTNSASHHLYVPCILTPRPAQGFELGPLRFTHVTDFVGSQKTTQSPMFGVTFGDMLRDMDLQRDFWIAEVDVDLCMPKRARELGELAVDLAVATLQILVHPSHTQNMGRA